MEINENVQCVVGNDDIANQIRGLFVMGKAGHVPGDYPGLNKLLNDFAQRAFDLGREYEKQQKMKDS